MGARKVVTADPQFDVSSTINAPKTNALQAVRINRQRVEYEFVDPKVKADFETLHKLHAGDIDGISANLDDTQWVVTYVSDNAPVYWYLYDRTSRQGTLLFSNRPALEKFQLAAMKPG